MTRRQLELLAEANEEALAYLFDMGDRHGANAMAAAAWSARQAAKLIELDLATLAAQ
jgi:hypothetical protein